jgi:hypothetical protein
MNGHHWYLQEHDIFDTCIRFQDGSVSGRGLQGVLLPLVSANQAPNLAALVGRRNRVIVSSLHILEWLAQRYLSRFVLDDLRPAVAP